VHDGYVELSTEGQSDSHSSVLEIICIGADIGAILETRRAIAPKLEPTIDLKIPFGLHSRASHPLCDTHLDLARITFLDV
jgi:hypothetical protein